MAKKTTLIIAAKSGLVLNSGCSQVGNLVSYLVMKI